MLEKQELEAILNLLNRANISVGEAEAVVTLKRKIQNEMNPPKKEEKE